jgi:hypothetical protein
MRTGRRTCVSRGRSAAPPDASSTPGRGSTGPRRTARGAGGAEGAGTEPPDAPHARKKDRQEAARLEQAGDEARLLYVALTRARDRCIVWWWPVSGSDRSLLATLLFGDRDADGALVDGAVSPKLKDLTDALTATLLSELAARADGTIDVAEVPAAMPDGHHVPAAPARTEEPSVATLGATCTSRTCGGGRSPACCAPAGRRTHRRRRCGDGAARRHGRAGRTGCAGRRSMVRSTPAPPPRRQLCRCRPLRTGPSGPLIDLPGGTTFGVLVHEALEVVDLSAEPDVLAAELTRELEQRATRGAMTVDVARLTDGLVAALSTPLDPLLPGMRCATSRRATGSPSSSSSCPSPTRTPGSRCPTSPPPSLRRSTPTTPTARRSRRCPTGSSVPASPAGSPASSTSRCARPTAATSSPTTRRTG